MSFLQTGAQVSVLDRPRSSQVETEGRWGECEIPAEVVPCDCFLARFFSALSLVANVISRVWYVAQGDGIV